MNTFFRTEEQLQEFIQSTRESLKIELFRDRSTYSILHGRVTTCPICGEIIKENDLFDLHEGLISRGQVTGQNVWLIHDERNCVLRHRACKNGQIHGGGIGGDLAFMLCLAQIIHYETLEEIYNWLEVVEVSYPMIANQTRYRITKTIKEMEEGKRDESNAILVNV